MVHAPAEPYPALDHLRVVDAMHAGLITCSLDVPLRTVARMMASYRVHAILVTAHGEEVLAGGGLWGVVSDVDLLQAAQVEDFDRRTAGTVAATPVVMVTSSDDLARAAGVMIQYEITHLVVVEEHSSRPSGIVSTLDIARALARFPERHPVAF